MFVLGDVPVGDTLYLPFNTYDSNRASVTITGLAVTDIEIYKDGSVEQRASDNGYALLDTDGIDFDGSVGLHGFSVDLNDNSHVGFYAAGSTYWINVDAITVDAQTVRFTYHFTIGKLLRPTTAGRTLTVSGNGEGNADLTFIHGTALTETAGQLAGRFTDFFDQAAATHSVATSLADFKATGFAVAGDEMDMVAAPNATALTAIAAAAWAQAGRTLSGLAEASNGKLDDMLDGTGGVDVAIKKLALSNPAGVALDIAGNIAGSGAVTIVNSNVTSGYGLVSQGKAGGIFGYGTAGRGIWGFGTVAGIAGSGVTNGDGILAEKAGTGVDVRGNITGNLSGSAGSVSAVGSGAIIAASFGDNAIAAAKADAALCNKIADHLLRRIRTNVEASSDGDTLGLDSLYSLICQLQDSDTTTNPGKLTLFKTDDTELGQLTLASDASADPTTGVR